MPLGDDAVHGGLTSKDQILKDLKDNRKYVRQKLTLRCNKISNNVDSFSVDDGVENLEFITMFGQKLMNLDEQIGTIIFSQGVEEKSNEEMEQTETYENKISSAKRKLNAAIAVLSGPTPGVSSYSNPTGGEGVGGGRASLPKMKLPELPLPKYGRLEGENLVQFFSNFEDIITKYNLSEYERFIYLERQLSNEPLILIKSLTGTQRCYGQAKELLCKAFARPIQQKFDTVKRLANLDFQIDEPYKFISEVRLILSCIVDLKIDTDTMAQYFVWTAIPQVYQNQLLHITNSINPTLDEIQAHIFEAIDRVAQSAKPKLSHASLAANISMPNAVKTRSNPPTENYAFKPCCLCSTNGDSDHPIHKCKFLS